MSMFCPQCQETAKTQATPLKVLAGILLEKNKQCSP